MQNFSSQQRFLADVGIDLGHQINLEVQLGAPKAIEALRYLEDFSEKQPACRLHLEDVKYQKYPNFIFDKSGSKTFEALCINERTLHISFCPLVWDIYSVLKILDSSLNRRDLEISYAQDLLVDAESEMDYGRNQISPDWGITTPKIYDSSHGVHFFSLKNNKISKKLLEDALSNAAFSRGNLVTEIDICSGQLNVIGNLSYTVIGGKQFSNINDAYSSHALVVANRGNIFDATSIIVLPDISGVDHISVKSNTSEFASSIYLYGSSEYFSVSFNLSKKGFSEIEAYKYFDFVKSLITGEGNKYPPLNVPQDLPRSDNLSKRIFDSLISAPDRAVLISSKKSISRLQLLKAASFIQSLIDVEQKIVGIIGGNTSEYIAAALACVFAGKTFVPLDLNAGEIRLREIVHHSSMELIIDTIGGSFMREDNHIKWIDISEEVWNIDCEKLSPAIGGSEIYRIYTSGSTGVPKGVTISEKNLTAFFQSYDERFPKVFDKIWSFTSAIGFDASIKQYIGTLLNSGTISIPNQSLYSGGLETVRNLQRLGTQVLNLTPSLLDVFLKDENCLQGFEMVFVGGEACSAQVVKRFFHRTEGCRLINLYGPTECTINVTSHEFSRNYSTSISPIGEPLLHAQIALITEKSCISAYCEDGYLIVAGPLVAKDFSAVGEGFFDSKECYNTHDRCKIWFDDNIYYLGRDDAQIKVNGVRLDLSELSINIKRAAGLDEAYVVMLDERLFVFINTDSISTFQRDELLNLLEGKNFSYIKIYPVFVKKWIWTANGKLNFKAMLNEEIQHKNTLSEEQLPVNSLIEFEVLNIVNDLCSHRDLPSIGPDDELINSGFDSLLYMDLIIDIEKKLGRSLSPADVAGENTARTIAKKCEEISVPMPLLRWIPGVRDDSLVILIPPVVGRGVIFDKFIEDLIKENSIAIFDYPKPYKGMSLSGMAKEFSEYLLDIGVGKYEEVHVIGYSMGGSLGFELTKILEGNDIYVNNLHIIDKGISNRLNLDVQLDSNKSMLEASFAGREISETLKASLMKDIASYTEVGFNYRVSSKTSAPITLTVCQHAEILIGDDEWNPYTESFVTIENIQCKHEVALDANYGNKILSRYFNRTLVMGEELI